MAGQIHYACSNPEIRLLGGPLKLYAVHSGRGGECQSRPTRRK